MQSGICKLSLERQVAIGVSATEAQLRNLEPVSGDNRRRSGSRLLSKIKKLSPRL